MSIKRKIVAVCDICGWMTAATDMVGATEEVTENFKVPDNWSHGKEGIIDICPRCSKKLNAPDTIYRRTRTNYFEKKEDESC